MLSLNEERGRSLVPSLDMSVLAKLEEKRTVINEIKARQRSSVTAVNLSKNKGALDYSLNNIDFYGLPVTQSKSFVSNARVDGWKKLSQGVLNNLEPSHKDRALLKNCLDSNFKSRTKHSTVRAAFDGRNKQRNYQSFDTD